MAVVWDEGSRPSCSETLHRRVRNGSRVSKNSLMRNVGAGSSSQLFDGALPIRFRTNCCVHGVNDEKEQSVGVKWRRTSCVRPDCLDFVLKES